MRKLDDLGSATGWVASDAPRATYRWTKNTVELCQKWHNW